MTEVRRALLVVVPVSIVVCLVAILAVQAVKRAGAAGQTHTMRGEADALIEEKMFAQAADALEGLQMRLMKERRYEEALKVSASKRCPT